MRARPPPPVATTATPSPATSSATSADSGDAAPSGTDDPPSPIVTGEYVWVCEKPSQIS